MTRALLIVACCLLAAAPAGVTVGLWLAFGLGIGLVGGGVVCGLIGVWMLTADLLPDPPGEVIR